MFKNVEILEFGDYIWNHHVKYIEISIKNMPSIGLEICETKRFCMDGETNCRARNYDNGVNIRVCSQMFEKTRYY